MNWNPAASAAAVVFFFFFPFCSEKDLSTISHFIFSSRGMYRWFAGQGTCKEKPQSVCVCRAALSFVARSTLTPLTDDTVLRNGNPTGQAYALKPPLKFLLCLECHRVFFEAFVLESGVFPRSCVLDKVMAEMSHRKIAQWIFTPI